MIISLQLSSPWLVVLCYVSVTVLEGPEQLLSESVQAGRHRERHHSATPRPRLGLRASLDRLVILVSSEGQEAP